MYRVSLLVVFCLSFCGAFAQKGKVTVPGNREYIQLRIYHASDTQQLASIEQYLQASLLPALEKGGFDRIGVFTAADNDTARDKRVYMLLPFKTMQQLERLTALASKTINEPTTDYARAAHNAAPYTRMETILLRSFNSMPKVKAPKLAGPRSSQVYELRSYESATEALHENKVLMFDAEETALFEKLGFNAVFYGQVLAGSRMPNLMYMTSFENRASRDEHWKAFGNAPEWKTMSVKPQYQNNVSKIDIVFLTPAPYSRL